MKGGPRRPSMRPGNFDFGAARRKTSAAESVEGLVGHDIELMSEQFHIFDSQNQGFINRYDLKPILEAVGENPSDSKMSEILKRIDDNNTKRFDLRVVLKALAHLKELNTKEEEDNVDYDILNTFVALGGNQDKSGIVSKSKILFIVNTVFELPINMEEMFEEAGIDVEEDLTFYDFTCLLESGGTQRASRICSIFSVN